MAPKALGKRGAHEPHLERDRDVRAVAHRWRCGAAPRLPTRTPQSATPAPPRGPSGWWRFCCCSSALAALAFVALFVLDPDTQLLGLALGVALALLAAALVLAGRRLVPQETKVEHRPRLARPGGGAPGARAGGGGRGGDHAPAADSLAPRESRERG